MNNQPFLPVFESREAKDFIEKCSHLGSGFHQEGSIKLQPSHIIDKRILLGIEKSLHTPQQWQSFYNQLGVPDTAKTYLSEILGNANTVLFAVEEGDSTELKLYLEFWEYLVQLIQQGKHNKEAFALNQGVKWNPQKPTQWIHDTYWCYPMQTSEEIRAKLKKLLQQHYQPFVQTLACILHDSPHSDASNDLIYLEVANKNSQRRSFDINCYKKGLLLRDIIPAVTTLISSWPIASEFSARITPALDLPLGHISGGLNRSNEPFLTLYFELP